MNLKNKEILQEANKAILAGDYEQYLSFCAEDTVWIFIGDQKLTGKSEVRKYMEKTYTEPPQFNVEHLVAEGELVIATGKISIKNEHGKMSTAQYCDVWKFKDGKMSELKAYVVPE